MRWQTYYNAALKANARGQAGRERRLAAAAERAVERGHSDPLECGRAWKLLAQLHDHAERSEDAERLYRRSLESLQRHLEPDHPDVLETLALMASFYRASGRERDAADVQGRLDEAVSWWKPPESAAAPEKASDRFNASRRAPRARLQFFPPSDVLARYRCLAGPASPFCLMAQYYHSRGWHEWALEAYEHAIDMDAGGLSQDHPSVATSIEGRDLILKVLGPAVGSTEVAHRIELLRQKLEEADETLRSEDPKTRAQAWLNRGRQLWWVDEYSLATEAYRQGLDAQSDDPEINYDLHVELARCLNHLCEFEAVEAPCRHAIDIEPARPRAYEELGLALQGLERWADAAEAFMASVRASEARIPRGLRLLERLLEERPAVVSERPGLRKAIEACRERGDSPANQHGDYG